MRKEVLWAIAAGIVFGFIIAFGIVRINSSFQSRNETPESSSTPIPNPADFKIVLDRPENEDVVTQNSATVSGITKSKTILAIAAEKEDYLVLADEKGFFEKEVSLIPGANQIIVTKVNLDSTEIKTQDQEKIIVIYSAAFEEAGKERLEKAARKPKSYLGTVTDITDSTIQIRTISSEIKQISVSEDTHVVKTGSVDKIVKLADIAIGDFLVAMGYKNGNHVLSAQRILITPPLTEPKVAVAKTTGANITPAKNTLVYLFKDGQVTKTKDSAVKDESQVITVTVETDGQSSLRTVFVVE